jgi:hypothetical protein
VRRSGTELRRVVQHVSVGEREVQDPSLSKSKNTAPKPTNGSVAAPMPLSGVAYVNSRTPRPRNRLNISKSRLVTDEVQAAHRRRNRRHRSPCRARAAVGGHRHAGTQRASS